MSAHMHQPLVRAEQVSYTYAGRSEPTLRKVSLAIEQGSWTVIAGRTGSGKSTLLRAMSGWLARHGRGAMSGQVWLDGRNAASLTNAQSAALVGLTQQTLDDQFCATAVCEEIAFGLSNQRLAPDEIEARQQAAIERFGLLGGRNTPIDCLSGGEKQRLLLASWWAIRPRALFLDEPLAQLDTAAVQELLSQLQEFRRSGMSIVVVEHRLDELLAHAERLIVVEDGSIVADVPTNHAPTIADALGRGGLVTPEVIQLAVRCNQPEAIGAEPLIVSLGLQRETPTQRREPTNSAAAVSRLLCRVENLGHTFVGQQIPLWEHVSFELRAGECVAVVGPNGSGKSTLLAALAGLRQATSGTIAWSADASKACPVGLLPQNPDLSLIMPSVREELGFGPQQQGCKAAEADARTVHIATALRLEKLLDELPQSLSQGERLRTALGAVLTMKPGVLLLDEPTTGQDQEYIVALLQALVESIGNGQLIESMVFATHDLHAVFAFATRVLVLAEGKLLADGSPAELLDNPGLLRAAQLRLPPLFELRNSLGLKGCTVDELGAEINARLAREGQS